MRREIPGCFRKRALTHVKQKKKKKERETETETENQTKHLLFISKQSKQGAAGAEFTDVSQDLEILHPDFLELSSQICF